MSIASRLEAIENHLSDAYDAIEAKGANLHLLPSGYTKVDYIESSGTQYIDTGVNADSNLRVVLDMAYLYAEDTNLTNVGVINSGDGYKRYHMLQQGGYFRCYANTSSVNIAEADTNRHIFDFDVPNRKFIIDNIENTFSAGDFDTGLNYWLFGRNANVSNLIFYNYTMVYGTKMYYNNVLVRDFIPCYRNSDNEVGLYDLVNDVFYTNQGTGVFTYGEVKEDYAFEKNISNLSRAINLIPTD